MSDSVHLKEAARVIAGLREKLAEARDRRREPIAIVGVASRTPFESQGATMWEGLSRGIDASSEVPAERWDADAHYDPSGKTVGASSSKRASFLADVANFDAPFFSISAVEAQALDPQQRLILETTWEALANAGTPLPALRSLNTGVFLGACAADYRGLVLLEHEGLPDSVQPYLMTGTSLSVLAGRISYALGLTGPSMIVDTACSSSLVAIHLACESLRARSSDVALVGGVSLILIPLNGADTVGALSKDGRCRSFDASGTGFGRGEGCGIAVLKRLSDAVRDGDRVLAVIRASAVNQDGPSDGLTAPSGVAQKAVIRTALEFAKINPSDVQYVEAHGTGTVLGDPIEVDALSEVYGLAHSETVPLAIGSVKSNFGHTEAAAGICGLLKVVLSIQHRQLPPSLHFNTPNPHIPWDDIALRVQTTLGPWPEPAKPLLAGISSFGISGTNAHLIVGEPPAEAADTWKEADRLATEAKLLPLCVSAKTPEALRAYANRFAEYLSSPLEAPVTWRDVAFTSSLRQTHLEHRLVVVGANPSDWKAGLTEFAKGERSKTAVSGDATNAVERVVFVFSGQGTQWWAMGRDLIAKEPVFRAVLEECDGYIRKDAEWSLLEELARDEGASRLNRTDIAQAALVSLQIALTRLYESWGVVPSAVVGHSVGEISAACAAGVLTLEQACHVATIRGRVMHKASGRGKMVSVRSSAEKAEALTRDFPGRLVVGAYNSPQSVVLSGEAEAMATAVAQLKSQGVGARELGVDYAFHSPQMQPFKSELTSALGSLKPSAPQIPIVSTLTGTTGGAFDAAYWADQMAEPVQFVSAIRTLLARDELFVEVGPHPVLLASIDEIASQSSRRAVVIGTLRRNEDQARCALSTLGALHAAGYPIDWTKIFPVPGRVATLPSYPWQRQRYWLPIRKKAKALGNVSKWSLVQTSVESSDEPTKHIFEVELDANEDGAHGYLVDRKLNGAVSLAGVVLAEMVLEANEIAFEGTAFIEDFVLSAPIVAAAGETVVVQLVVQSEHEGSYRFRIASRPTKKTPSSKWTEHATGRLATQVTTARPQSASANAPSLRELAKRCTIDIPTRELYNDYEDAGLLYGPSFRALEQAWSGVHEALSKLAPIAALTEHVRGHVLHPLLLEAALQTLAVAVPTSAPRTPYLLSKLGTLRIIDEAAPRWIHVVVRSLGDDADVIESDVHFLDESGLVVAEMKGVLAEPLEHGDAPMSTSRDPGVIQAQLWKLLKPFTSHPSLTDDTNLLAGVLDSLAAISFLRSIEKEWGGGLSTKIRGQFAISVRSLAHAITESLTTTDRKASPPSRKSNIVVPDPARASARATLPGRAYPELFGPDGLPSNVWETDVGPTLEVVEQGSGRPLLLLPPVGCEMTVWKPFLQHLKKERHVIAPNLPGYGRSPLGDPPTLEVIGSSLLAILDRIAPAQPIDVVGWSIGGFIAQLLAAAAPERFGSVILVNTTAHLGVSTFEEFGDVIDRLETDLRRDLPSAERPEDAERLVYWGKESRSVHVSLIYGSLIQSFDGRPVASEIKASTLVIGGANDLGTPPAMSVALNKSLPGSRIEVLPNIGHYLPLLRPEEFARLATEHLPER